LLLGSQIAVACPRRNNEGMESRLLPLFPLQAVVFPRTELPLHIFEERYKEMVGDAIRNNSEFGIVLAKEDGIVNAGCTVVVEKVLKTYADGRMDIMARGRRRFEVVLLNEEKTYLRGEVEFFDDDEPGPGPEELQQRVLIEYRRLLEIGHVHPPAEPNLSDPQLSFQLAQTISDLDFLHVLLRNRSEADRLRELSEYLTQYVPRQRQIARVQQLAPRNGFGRKLAM
jgi:Lon protease-like protein